MSHKAGFVNIIGNPNVGKSTLMNALVGERLSIITSKAQTTRHRILGIVNGDDFQILFSARTKPKNRMVLLLWYGCCVQVSSSISLKSTWYAP